MTKRFATAICLFAAFLGAWISISLVNSFGETSWHYSPIPVNEPNMVFIGLCSGGRHALEAAAALGAKGAISINTGLYAPRRLLEMLSPSGDYPPELVRELETRRDETLIALRQRG